MNVINNFIDKDKNKEPLPSVIIRTNKNKKIDEYIEKIFIEKALQLCCWVTYNGIKFAILILI